MTVSGLAEGPLRVDSGQDLRTRKRTLGRPRAVLQDYPISVRILKGRTLPIPVWVEGRNRLETQCRHAFHPRAPLGVSGQVEDYEMVLARRSPVRMSRGARKLEVVRRATRSKHHTVEAIVALKSVEHGQPQSIPIEREKPIDVVRRPRHTQGWNLMHARD